MANNKSNDRRKNGWRSKEIQDLIKLKNSLQHQKNFNKRLLNSLHKYKADTEELLTYLYSCELYQKANSEQKIEFETHLRSINPKFGQI